jgi:hypothetical protein
MNPPDTLQLLRAHRLTLLGLLAASLWGAPGLGAQAPAPAPDQAPVRHARRHVPPKPVAPPAAATPVAAAPAAVVTPEAPKWPVNEHPSEASVVWDSHGLRVDAANSSLRQILDDFSAASGVKVEGLDSDQRIFGVYGPGQARDVLAQLLQGSGYNVLMVGDLGQGTPRQILLTPRQGGDKLPLVASTPSTDEDADTDDQPPQPAPQRAPPGGFRPPMLNPGNPMRGPQRPPEPDATRN